MTEESLFAAALAYPSPDERRAFLDRACGADTPLRRRLERLLAAGERTAGILDTPAVADDAPLAPGRVIDGRYRLTNPLGEGGMGQVWAADQTDPTPRPVALKFLHARYPAGSPAAVRFVDEAKITARLQHPGVPPVHHVGRLPDGRPYLVMKLIAGQTLDALVKEHGPGAARWVGVFEGVCQAVGYAHAHGVIHRDLKPANVMVGAFGEVQVMDWGLAREVRGAGGGTREGRDGADDPTPALQSALDTPQLTKTGSVLGTPAFMAPEQANGAGEGVNERSDVFGLGAVLCTLLTGRPPYAGTDAFAVRMRAMCGDTAEAFARLDSCGAEPDLIALCKRCLSSDPAGRPADGAAVADAVGGLRRASEERARTAEVDRARAEEGRKRGRLALVGGGLLVAALAAGVVGTSVGMVRADDARAKEVTVRMKAETDRDRTEALLDTISRVSADMQADPVGFDGQRTRMLTQLLAHHAEYAADPGTDEPSRRRAAVAALRAGEVESLLDRPDAAVASFRTAGERFDALLTAHPDTAEYRRGLATSHLALADELSDPLKRYADAEPHYRRAIEARRPLADPEDVRAGGDARHALGVMLWKTDRFADAKVELSEAHRIREDLAGSVGKPSSHSHRLAVTLLHLGRVEGKLSDPDGAERHFRRAAARLGELIPLAVMPSAYRRDLAEVLHELGVLQMGRLKWDEAERLLTQATDHRSALTSEALSAPARRFDAALTHLQLATLYALRKKWAAAETNYRVAVTLLEKLTADRRDPADGIALGNAYFGMGVVQFGQEKHADSLPWLDKGVTTLTPLSAGSPATAASLRNAHRMRAEVHTVRTQYARAVSDWEAVIALTPAADRAKPRASRAYTLAHAGEAAKATAEVDDLTKGGQWTGDEWYDFACTYAVAAGKTTTEAAGYADRAMAMLRKAVDAGWRDVGHAKEDADLLPLGKRDDFKKLLAGLEK